MQMITYTRDTLIREVLTSHVGAAAIFEHYGLSCAVCLGADMETLASVATMHEISVTDLLDDLNALDPGNSEVGA
jgi:hybrid cluster-associated redox disulfide protein